MKDSKELIDDYLHGSLDENGQAELRAWLEQDPANMRCFTQELMFDEQIRAAIYTKEFGAALHSLEGSATSKDHATPGTIVPLPKRLPRKLPALAAAAAAVVVLGLSFWRFTTPPAAENLVARESSEIRVSASAPPDLVASHPVERQFSHFSAQPAAGNLVALDSRWILLPGADADYRILDPNRVQLLSGELRFTSLEPASLMVETPVATATAQGTDFFIGTHAVAANNPTQSNKQERIKEMKSQLNYLTRVIVLTGVVTLANAHGEATAKADNLLVAESEKAPVRHAIAANTELALSLYGKLAPTEGNLFISPYSISSAMGMAYAGARENTATELATALGITIEQEHVPAALKALTSILHANAETNGQKLAIANGLCLTGADVAAAYKEMLARDFDAEIFKGDLDAINAWVNNKTEGKIDKLLTELNPNSVCVLLNAIYFKGTWETEFDKEKTREASFEVIPGSSIPVQMMHRKGGYKLHEDEEFQMLELPYKGKSASMVIVLPRAVAGLADLEAKLNTETLTGWLAKLDERNARKSEVFLPRFKMETEFDLVPSFRAMGVKDAFEFGTADFTGTGWSKGKLCISQIKHKAFVEVNEEGTEAAAATAVELSKMSAASITPIFRADHPFLFLIRDNATGTILFMGRISDPTKG